MKHQRESVDLIVRGGTVVDGTGAPARTGDVAIAGDRIVVVGDVDLVGREEIDASGLIVAPGFVDAHSHMDAQVFWDHLGMPACWHGVTTTVMGNCGFTLAPARSEAHELVARNLERAEDIPASAMAEGLPWNWQTFSEFLDAVEGTPKGINYAASIGHSALRTWAMGERAFDGPATDDDLEVMAAELRAALAAGASGFTTSRSSGHATSDGRPVASRLAAWSEIELLVGILGAESSGVFQLAPERYHEKDRNEEFLLRLQRLALTTGAPVACGLFGNDLPQPSLELIEDTIARGGKWYGFTHSRGVVSAQSFRSHLAFDKLPEWQALRSRPEADQKTMLRDPEVRARLVHAAHHGDYGQAFGPEARKPEWERLQVLLAPFPPNPTVADEASRRGVDPVEAMIDIALEHDFDVVFVQELVTQEDEKLLRLMRHPQTAMGFSDSGAHVSQIFDSSIYSHLLGYWVRERQAFPLEEAVNMITARPAAIWNLADRGQLAPGFAADIAIFDAATVGPRLPTLVTDVPGENARFEQHADGFAATIVNGQVLTRDGAATGARPGRLLRAEQHAS
jgi:N-acyl-D-aspartate/D-glutamate deacylase